ncbi:MAG: pentapeptide repeat-containing protein [Cycloclasticus sp.]|nr:pentapeptide repeat-containing protein [Cycloclasticus sp.]
MLEEKTNAMYMLLKVDDVGAFNEGRQRGEDVDLSNAKFRAFDLREANLAGLDLSGCYFKNADLRGVDLRGCNLEGCSFFNAKISGVYFPSSISAEEINLSLLHGTRIRMGS